MTGSPVSWNPRRPVSWSIKRFCSSCSSVRDPIAVIQFALGAGGGLNLPDEEAAQDEEQQNRERDQLAEGPIEGERLHESRPAAGETGGPQHQTQLLQKLKGALAFQKRHVDELHHLRRAN